MVRWTPYAALRRAAGLRGPRPCGASLRLKCGALRLGIVQTLRALLLTPSHARIGRAAHHCPLPGKIGMSDTGSSARCGHSSLIFIRVAGIVVFSDSLGVGDGVETAGRALVTDESLNGAASGGIRAYYRRPALAR